jgi:hypothetical protein
VAVRKSETLELKFAASQNRKVENNVKPTHLCCDNVGEICVYYEVYTPKVAQVQSKSESKSASDRKEVNDGSSC